MNGKFCTSCGRSVTAELTHCTHCGVELHRLCVTCGAVNRPNSRFCGECGALQSRRGDDRNVRLLLRARSVDAAGAPDDAASERREVTVVFVDASNFTAASNRLDSEDVYRFVDEAMRLLVEVVAEYDGTIDKFTGDGLMAVFGAPVAHENDAERAVRAAWEMQRVIGPFRDRLRAQHGFDFRIRIGVNSGEVVAGRIGSNLHTEYTVIGDTVNIAARLQAAAEVDSVLVSSTTYQRTFWNFRYEAIPPLSLKGIPGTVQAYCVAGLGSPSRARPSLQDAALVGRDDALGELHAAYRGLVEHRRLAVSVVTGDAGVGKTRFVSEFARSIDTSVYEAHCLSFGRERPLALVVSLARAVLGIDPTDPSQAQVESARNAMRRIGENAPDLVPYLVTALEVPNIHTIERQLNALDETMLRQQTHAALRTLLVGAARTTPLVIILDDLQWIDSASRDFLHQFIQTTSEEPFLVVLVCRAGDAETAIRPLLDVAAVAALSFRRVDLGPLADSDATQLVRNLLPGDSAGIELLRRRLVTRAEGNPFAAEELTRTLIDGAGVQQVGEEWTVTPQAAQLLNSVPATLRGLVLARFDALPRDLRRLLQHAAVLGRSFHVELLQQLVQGDVGELAQSLTELVERGFLVEEPAGLDRRYKFRHALLQDAVHATLLKRERQELHSQAAAVVERAALWTAAERDELLAYHYAESTNPRLAIPHLISTAEFASRRYASDLTVELCRRAQGIMASESARADDYFRVQVVLGRALKFLGRLTEAETILRDAAAQLREQSATGLAVLPLYVEMLREFADVHNRAGALDEAYVRLEEAWAALAVWNEPPSSWMRRAVADRMAWVRFRQGRLDEALAIAEPTLLDMKNDATADVATMASLHNTLGGIAWQQGDLDAAAAQVRESVLLHQRLGYLFGTAIAYGNLGVLDYARGQWKSAVQSFEQSDAIRQQIGYMVGRAANLQNLALLRMAAGQHEAARHDLETSLRISRQLGEHFDSIHALLGLAHLAIIERRFSEAAETLADLRTTYASRLSTDDLAQIEWMSAVTRANESIDEGVRSAEQAVQLAQECGVPETEADCTRTLGVLLTDRGDYDGAQASLERSYEIAVKIGDPYRRAQALLEIATLSHRRGASAHEFSAPLQEAIATFRQLGATHDLKRAMAAAQLADAGAIAE